MGAPGPTDSPCIKSVLTWKRQGDALVSQINFWSYSGSAPSSGTLSLLAASIASNASDGFASLCDTFTGVTACTCTDISVEPVVQGEGASPWVGTRSGALLAPSTSAVVNKKPSNPYRGGKPKNFLPLGTGGDVADTGLWSSVFTGDVAGGYLTFHDETVALVIAGMSIVAEVMVSYYTGGSIVTVSPTTGRARNTPKKRGVTYGSGPPTGTWTPKVFAIAGRSVSDKIGSQRKRNRNA